ncbi:AAA family ATPase [Sphingomonas sp. CFBP 13603]|uniref:ATP-binding protein n=1 Tax=Sphingomonas sp. CFBP 13603 TaxID=2774040 RepID=UPI001866651A|nr:YhaN family protein [Sphingomonas sp. CFBP 13603]MBE2993063.1 AAA family ATPase [Sphingomonas sp. CFBP 13603]
MRFRRLELVRYGGFADRVFDFGSAGPGLHLIIGPNEAGKSTALQAISDFLFGIPAQSRQNWRYEYAQLRLRALIEHDGELLDITRRKGNRDTLLTADGTPFKTDPLAPLLGGIDRAGFERMFGLDHAKLREGGASIIGGRDDAARITLEAGTGVSHIGSELAKLTEVASSLFKAGGQNPPVNRLMRERSEALAQVRQTSISDADWTQARQRRGDAEARRTALIEEAEALDREQARLDRVGRARAPLGRLTTARSELAELEGLPLLPTDAAAQLATLRADRIAAGELMAQGKGDRARIHASIAGVEKPGIILTEQERVEALEERRPVIAKAATDFERRRAELERIDARLSAALAEAQIAPGEGLPSAGWRKRTSAHLDACRLLSAREASLEKDRAKLVRDRERIEGELAAIGGTSDPAALVDALQLLPADAAARLADAELAAKRKRTLAAERLADLAPWQGLTAALHTLAVPTEAEATAVRVAAEAARNEAAGARKEADAAEISAIRAEARLKGLIASGSLPTPDVVAAARQQRDALVGQVREYLGAPQKGNNEALGQALDRSISDADHLADRRDVEASRIAEYVLTTVAFDEANALLTAARRREGQYRTELALLEEGWASRLQALGFMQTVAPADLSAWLTKRSAVLEAARDAATSEATFEALAAQFATAGAAVAKTLSMAGGPVTTADDPALVTLARSHAAALSVAITGRGRLMAEITKIESALDELALESAAVRRDTTSHDLARAALIREAALPSNADDTVLADALEALVHVTEETGARETIARQVDSIVQDLASFDAELAVVLTEIGAPRSGDATEQVRQLAISLRAAIRARDALAVLEADRQRIGRDLDLIEGRLASIGTTVGALMEAANTVVEADLDSIIAKVARRDTLRLAEREALVELAGADNGTGLEALAAEIASLTVEEASGARTRIEDRRREVAAEREIVGRTLNAADEEAGRAASDSAAADAQQMASDTTAALAQAAEEHIQAASAAALLRWMLDRHRTTNQAPLIARAGVLFAGVTSGAFKGLTVGYGNDDRPIILAQRSDGCEVGVEALSEGTRDQLYLALRLGSIEGRAGAGSLPIVCDDLLITADDARAGALLRVLAAAAAHSQVIVFSHHAHLIDVARNAVGSEGFKLHVIETAGSIAA